VIPGNVISGALKLKTPNLFTATALPILKDFAIFYPKAAHAVRTVSSSIVLKNNDFFCIKINYINYFLENINYKYPSIL
jgi:hypothetical protein